MEIKDTFPPMNGEFSPEEARIDEDENLEAHLTDDRIGRDVIYAAFSWSLVEEAYALVKELAQKHGVGFFNVSASDGEILLPNGTALK